MNDLKSIVSEYALHVVWNFSLNIWNTHVKINRILGSLVLLNNEFDI